MIGHISKHKSIPTHKHHASIIFQEFIPKDKSFATPRASFASNYVSDQTEMNFETVREIFVHHRSKNKNLLHFYTDIMVLEQCQKYRCHGRIAALLE